MLTLVEKILFILAALASMYAAYRVAERIARTLLRGHGKPDLSLARKRLVSALVKVAVLQPTFKIRFWPSLFHAFIAWGFIYYLLVNLGDVLEASSPASSSWAGHNRRDLPAAGRPAQRGRPVGMIAMLLRRFVLQDP